VPPAARVARAARVAPSARCHRWYTARWNAPWRRAAVSAVDMAICHASRLLNTTLLVPGNKPLREGPQLLPTGTLRDSSSLRLSP
jgi:hypothetical protein